MDFANEGTASSLQCVVIAFNDIGVDKYNAGDCSSAWELCKGALELLKILQNHSMQSQDDEHIRVGDDCRLDVVAQMNTNRYIRRAHLIVSQSQVHDIVRDMEVNGPCLRPLETAKDLPFEFKYSGRTDDILHFQPSIHSQPFYVPSLSSNKTDCDDSSLENASLISSIVMFNLGLMDYQQNGRSSRCIFLYELSLSLFTKRNVTSARPILMALLNNIACWHYNVFHDYDTAQSYMEQLESILMMSKEISDDKSQRSNASYGRDVPLMRMVTANIGWIMYPTGSASAAA